MYCFVYDFSVMVNVLSTFWAVVIAVEISHDFFFVRVQVDQMTDE